MIFFLHGEDPSSVNARFKAVSLAVLATISMFFVSAKCGKELFDHNRWVSHTAEVLVLINYQGRCAVAIGAAARGYVITGEDHYIDVLAVAKDQSDIALQSLFSLTRDNPNQQKRLQRLSELLKKRESLGEDQVQMRKKQNFNSKGLIASVDAGESMTNSMILILDDMDREERDLLKIRTLAKENAAKMTVAAWTGGVIFYMLILLIYPRFGRQMKMF